MNGDQYTAEEQAAYDALGDIQRYYRTHDVGAGSLWQTTGGYTVYHPNGEAKACIWGALIATGHATEGQYHERYNFKSLIKRALIAAAPDLGWGDSDSLVGINDGMIANDKDLMRGWLKKARALIKSGGVV